MLQMYQYITVLRNNNQKSTLSGANIKKKEKKKKELKRERKILNFDSTSRTILIKENSHISFYGGIESCTFQ